MLFSSLVLMAFVDVTNWISTVTFLKAINHIATNGHSSPDYARPEGQPFSYLNELSFEKDFAYGVFLFQNQLQ